MKPTFLICVLALLSVVFADDYSRSREMIDLIVENHLKLKMEPNEVQYRADLGSKLFEALRNRYPERSFFVAVYAPIMGFDNHAMRALDMYDRLHKKNNMRFNLMVASVIRKDYPGINAYETESTIEYARNFCFFQDCSSALKVKDFVEEHHGCLHGIIVLNKNIDQHIFENMSDHIMVKYTPYTDRYNLYAWVTDELCIGGMRPR